MPVVLFFIADRFLEPNIPKLVIVYYNYLKPIPLNSVNPRAVLGDMYVDTTSHNPRFAAWMNKHPDSDLTITWILIGSDLNLLINDNFG